MEPFDLIVIGAGPGGYVSAIRAAQLGMRVAIVESREIGGTCLNRGCIPTKALIHAATLYQEMQNSHRFGLFAENISRDLGKIFAYKTETVEKLRAGVEQLIRGNKITMICGTGTIQSSETVKVSGAGEEYILKARSILIATGSVPSKPPIIGADLPRVVTSDEVLAGEIKDGDRIAIIGGGVIGVEFATAFRALGFEVAILEAMPSLLSGMDKEISQNLKMILKKQGVGIFTDIKVEEITKGSSLCCHYEEKGEKKSLNADIVIMATGRRANTANLFDHSFSVAMERGRILVDDSFQTSEKGIYAVGDVIGSVQLAHAASAQGICFAEKLNSKEASIDISLVPSCVYTSPEIACVGLTADEAKKQNMNVRAGKFVTSANGKSLISMDERGFIKVLFDAETDVLLGAQIMCARATDMIGEMSTAIANKMTSKQLTKAIRSHPTYNEAVTEAIEDAYGEAIHIMPRK